MTTAAYNLAAELGQAARDQATKNGMTVEQMAACRILMGCKAVTSHPAFAAIAADRAASLSLFDRVALIPETNKGSCYIPDALLVAALTA
jgi:hypothetical protein